MKEIEYILPKKIEGVNGDLIDNPFKGKVVINVPNFRQRIELIKSMGFKTGSDGTMVPGDDPYESIFKMQEISAKHIISMEVIHKDSSQEFNSLEELEYYEEGITLISLVGKIILNGPKLGKN